MEISFFFQCRFGIRVDQVWSGLSSPARLSHRKIIVKIRLFKHIYLSAYTLSIFVIEWKENFRWFSTSYVNYNNIKKYLELNTYVSVEEIFFRKLKKKVSDKFFLLQLFFFGSRTDGRKTNDRTDIWPKDIGPIEPSAERYLAERTYGRKTFNRIDKSPKDKWSNAKWPTSTRSSGHLAETTFDRKRYLPEQT